jgi:hypothetical protein
MATVKPPKYNLTNSAEVSKPFVPPSRSRSPASTEQKLIQKSKLVARPAPAILNYSKKGKRRKCVSDEAETSSSSISTVSEIEIIREEPAFDDPSDLVLDFSFFQERKSTNSKSSILTPSPSSKTNVFISPEDILTPDSKHNFKDDLENAFECPSKIHDEITEMLGKFSSPSIPTCKFCRKPLPANFTETPPTATRGRIAYCQRHENATILEQGREKGYPTSVDLVALNSRVVKLLGFIKDDVINASSDSEFMRNLRKNTKRRNAANPMTMIDLFDDSQPGYYGPRGSEIISNLVMLKLGDYIRKNDNVYDDLKFCGGVSGFISAVVVPEVGIRLIMEDMEIGKEEARTIMRDSVAYGGIINASVEMSDDDDNSDDSD